MTVYVVIGRSNASVWIEGIGQTPGVANLIASAGAKIAPDKRVVLPDGGMIGPWRPADSKSGRSKDAEIVFTIERHEVHSA